MTRRSIFASIMGLFAIRKLPGCEVPSPSPPSPSTAIAAGTGIYTLHACGFSVSIVNFSATVPDPLPLGGSYSQNGRTMVLAYQGIAWDERMNMWCHTKTYLAEKPVLSPYKNPSTGRTASTTKHGTGNDHPH